MRGGRNIDIIIGRQSPGIGQGGGAGGRPVAALIISQRRNRGASIDARRIASDGARVRDRGGARRQIEAVAEAACRRRRNGPADIVRHGGRGVIAIESIGGAGSAGRGNGAEIRQGRQAIRPQAPSAAGAAGGRRDGSRRAIGDGGEGAAIDAGGGAGTVCRSVDGARIIHCGVGEIGARVGDGERAVRPAIDAPGVAAAAGSCDGAACRHIGETAAIDAISGA